jgi:hypothetical protein
MFTILLAPGRATLVSHEYHPNLSPRGHQWDSRTGFLYIALGTKEDSTLFSFGVFDPHHYPRSCLHGSIDQQRGVHSLPRSPTDGVHGQGQTKSNRIGREHVLSVPATCRQRGQRRKLISHTSLLVYVGTVTVTHLFFSGAPPFFAHPSINTNNAVNRVNVLSWHELRENSSTVQCKPRELNLVRSMLKASENKNLIQICCFRFACAFFCTFVLAFGPHP